ncbi:MAG: hypothetical protein QGI75_08715 [Phycisphaerales bacterium]|jgi:hypothetical protein|nr:hypothetical protein [Phycisphaerales bacterium]
MDRGVLYQIDFMIMQSLSPARLTLPILLIAGMVLHVSLPGFGCRVVAATTGGGGGCQKATQPCKRMAESRRCCRAMERAAEMTSCCIAKMPCGTQQTPPPCEDEPDEPLDDCTMGSCPVMRWVVLLEKNQIEGVAAFQLRRIDLDAMLPAEWVVCDLPPPEPPGTAARLSRHCAWLI